MWYFVGSPGDLILFYKQIKSFFHHHFQVKKKRFLFFHFFKKDTVCGRWWQTVGGGLKQENHWREVMQIRIILKLKIWSASAPSCLRSDLEVWPDVDSIVWAVNGTRHSDESQTCWRAEWVFFSGMSFDLCPLFLYNWYKVVLMEVSVWPQRPLGNPAEPVWNVFMSWWNHLLHFLW